VTFVVPAHNRADPLGKRSNRCCVPTGVFVDEWVNSRQSGQYLALTAICGAQSTEQRKTRNDGVRFAQTPWIAFCDDDDLWAPAKLRRKLDAAKSYGSTGTSLMQRLSVKG
jgi:hypothetical protein